MLRVVLKLDDVILSILATQKVGLRAAAHTPDNLQGANSWPRPEHQARLAGRLDSGTAGLHPPALTLDWDTHPLFLVLRHTWSENASAIGLGDRAIFPALFLGTGFLARFLQQLQLSWQPAS